MYIAKFKIQNYKSYLASEEIELTPGFNVIVGQNNAGKTALVEALSLQFGNKPHLSTKTSPSPGIILHDPNNSTVEIVFQLAAGEAEQLLVSARNEVHIPIATSGTGSDPAEQAAKFLELLQAPSQLKCVYQTNRFSSANFETIAAYEADIILNSFRVNIAQQRLEHAQFTRKKHEIGFDYVYGPRLATLLRDRIYMFKAERLNVSQSQFGAGTVLSSNASNLAEVLHNLQGSNPSRFRKLNQHTSTIFPEIKWIAVPSAPEEKQVRILVWSIDLDTEREDLAIPLAESGTGIGQVLAILYVVLTADKPQTIIIDEPQSFLNPGAVRKLLEILKRYPQHQFIITTHSPEVVSVVNPQTLFLLQKVEAETQIMQLDGTKTQDQKLLLSEVGARLSDVFGADNILWVEGATEEASFPLIVENILKKPLQGTKILGVVQTGDFESKHSETILKIYDRLTKGEGLIPPAVGFIFDREKRSQKDQDDLIRRSQGKVVFLPRMMYENYLLNPQAIAYVISHIEGFRDDPITPKEVQQELQGNIAISKYNTEEEWLREVHGAKVLEALFKKLSENRVEYDKVLYGVVLTEWIVNNAPADLQEIAALLGSKINN
jgi:predicted ATPase